MLSVPTVSKAARVCRCACLHCLLRAEELLVFDETTPLVGLTMASIAAGGARTEIPRFKDHDALVRPDIFVLLGHESAGDLAYA